MRTRLLAIPIEGLNCLGGGAIDIERRLARLPGITKVYVNPAMEAAYITFDPRVCRIEDMVAVIMKSGYRIRQPQTL